jgi:hypothetical protein
MSTCILRNLFQQFTTPTLLFFVLSVVVIMLVYSFVNLKIRPLSVLKTLKIELACMYY